MPYKALLWASVAPFTGAWIEILWCLPAGLFRRSLPSRERGLKSAALRYRARRALVAPFTGAWIEILKQDLAQLDAVGRSLHGSVD